MSRSRLSPTRVVIHHQRVGKCRGIVRPLICWAAVVMAASPAVHGHPMFGEVFHHRQPDGTRVDVRIWGDEYYRVVESMDGYTLVRDPNSGVTCYAQLSTDGNELVSTGVAVRPVVPAGLDIERRVRINAASARAKVSEARAFAAAGYAEVLGAQNPQRAAAPPNNGDVQGLVLLVDFSDDQATIPASDVDDYCNQVGYTGYGNNGSVRDYFFDVSDGHLNYTNFVPSAYYRAQHPKTYYTDPGVGYGTRARELIIEALTDLDNAGLDFSQYDANGDGLIDAINCFYAGGIDNVWAEGLWPHSWSVSFSADGVSTYRYQITNIGSSLTLYVFCHENGHMICYWPDLYDYDPPGPNDSKGVGKFCIMCSGTSSKNPQEPCAYMKYIAGWSKTMTLTTPMQGLTAQSGFNRSYKFEHPTAANEYYLIENRQKTGRDSGIPDHGLAIWHIDTYGNNDWQQATPTYHYEVTLVQADGDWDLENNVNYGDTTDLYGAPTYTECTPSTTPDTDWWSGGGSNLHITNISSSSSTMTFDFGVPISCLDATYCYDYNPCSLDQCIGSVCSNTANIYGDIYHDGTINVYDIFCILDGFGGDYSDCTQVDDDLDPCEGNFTINIDDLFAVLNAFGGADPCCGWEQ